MRKNLLKGTLAALSTLTVFVFFQNMNVNDPQINSLKQKIQLLNTRLTNSPGTEEMQKKRRAVRDHLLQSLARQARIGTCAALKALEPSTPSGFYKLYQNSASSVPDLVDCVFGPAGNVVEQATVKTAAQAEQALAAQTAESSSSAYYETVSLQASGTATPVRTAHAGILQIARVVPTSAQTPCPTSDYGFDATGIWVKNRCAGQFFLLTANGTRYLDAMDPTAVKPLKGSIGSVRLLAGNKLQVTGWACETENAQPIETQLYFGDAASGGVFISAKLTGLATGPVVSTQCLTRNVGHGFEYTVDLAQSSTLTAAQKSSLESWSRSILSDPAKNKLFMYAVSHKPQGFSLQKLDGSGTIPIVGPNQMGNIIGWFDNAVVANGQLTVRGWACHIGDPRSLDIHIYRNYPAGGGGIYIGGGAANVNHEPGVSNRCMGGGTAHRFQISIPTASKVLPSNAPLYVYGISVIPGKPNTMLGNSGTVKIPVYTGSPPLCTPAVIRCNNDERIMTTRNSLGCEVKRCVYQRSGSDR